MLLLIAITPASGKGFRNLQVTWCSSDRRAEYREMVTNLMNKSGPREISLSKNEFSAILATEQQFYVKKMCPGEGIALNEALWFVTLPF